MKKSVVLSNDVRNAVALFAEFGERGHYEHKGKVIIMNDVVNPKAEGIFLSRIARKVYEKTGDIEHAYQFALEAFTDNIYNRLQKRNKPAPWSKFILKKDEKELESYLMSCLPKA